MSWATGPLSGEAEICAAALLVVLVSGDVARSTMTGKSGQLQGANEVWFVPRLQSGTGSRKDPISYKLCPDLAS